MLFTFRNILFVFLAPLLVLAAPMYHPQAVTEVYSQAEKTLEQGKVPVVIFDLDDTLILTRTRTFRILRDFVSMDETRERFPMETTVILRMRLSQIAYYLKDTFKKIGLNNAAFIKEADAYWVEKFFSNEVCGKDSVVEGGPEYVNQLHSLGVHIVYLTGRDAPRMETCTKENLRLHNFPLGGRATLMMKPTKEMDDLLFKKEAFATIENLGVVVGGFENEPANVNAFKARFPRATMVFLDVAHSNKPDVPQEGIAWIRDYSRE